MQCSRGEGESIGVGAVMGVCGGIGNWELGIGGEGGRDGKEKEKEKVKERLGEFGDS